MISEDELERLRAEHGEVRVIDFLDNDIVIRPAKDVEYKRYRSMMFSESKREYAAEQLVRDTIVHPDKAAVKVLFARYPAMGETLGKEATKLAGLIDIDVKK